MPQPPVGGGFVLAGSEGTWWLLRQPKGKAPDFQGRVLLILVVAHRTWVWLDSARLGSRSNYLLRAAREPCKRETRSELAAVHLENPSLVTSLGLC